MDRQTRELSKIQEVQGPCHGNAVLAEGTVLVSTGIEGGPNENDHCAHLWQVTPDGRVQEVCKMKKDIFPLIVQYGVMRFPMGLESSDIAVFTAYALQGDGETVYLSESGRING